MASLTLPPAPPNPRQDAIDLHKAFKGPPRHYFPPSGSRPNFRLPHNSSGPATRSCCSIFVFGQILWLNEQEIMLWGHGGGNHRRYLVAWRLPYFPRMRVWGCVQELDEARIPYSRGAGRTGFRWQMGRWSRRVLVIRGLYRPLDISLREIDCSC